MLNCQVWNWSVIVLCLSVQFLALHALSIYIWLSNLLLSKLCAEATIVAEETTIVVQRRTPTVPRLSGEAEL